MTVDFKTNEARTLPNNYSFYTCSGHLVYREEENAIYSFGGVDSSGINYKLKLSEKEWEQSEQRHSLVANQQSMELSDNACLYFDRLELGLY